MTFASNIITLALKNSGVNGVGQTPSAEDANDALALLNDMIGQWNAQRAILVIPGTLARFPDLATDVPSWTGNENVLLTSLSARLRSAYGMPADELMNALAENAVQQLQANNKQQVAPLHGGVPTTPMQVIFLALRMAKRIDDKQSVSDASADVDSAFSLLVNMLAQWQRKRWLVPDLIDLAVVSTGAQSYTIGPARPDRIESAFVRLLATPGAALDYPLAIIEAREDYNQIALKSLATFPAAVFYDSAWPVGSIYVWPVPAAGTYEIHLSFKAPLATYATVDDALGLPPEYIEAMVSNLACRILALNGMEPSQYLAGQARAALGAIRMANAQATLLSMPASLSGGFGRGMPSTALFLSGAWR